MAAQVGRDPAPGPAPRRLLQHRHPDPRGCGETVDQDEQRVALAALLEGDAAAMLDAHQTAFIVSRS